jgi:hypothetical protein
MKTVFKFLFVITLFLTISCEEEEWVLYSNGGFPVEVVNLEKFNSKYDDYNSDLPHGEYDTYPLKFSSNRNSKGANFDIVQFNISISYPIEEDRVAIRESAGIPFGALFSNEEFDLINTEYDELGPLTKQYYDGDNYSYLHFYANNRSGNFDIKFIYHNLVQDPVETHKSEYFTEGPYNVNLINTANNEAYPTFMAEDLYFTSDENGN